MELELLDKLCRQYQLGTLECPPARLKGGFLHKMYSLFTSKGRYAVKLLNPYIMQRDTAMENYRTAEKLEAILDANGIPIIPALVLGNTSRKGESPRNAAATPAQGGQDGTKMQNLEGQFFYLYEWYNGKALKNEEITAVHCQRIGVLLAQIHALDRRREACCPSELHIDWDYYIEQLSAKNTELHRLLAENRSLLYESQNNGNLAVKHLPPVTSICHNDMDCKNVLWAGADCRIIDLECLGYSNPFAELYELALCWSGYERCHIDYDLFRCFLHSYAGAGGCLPADWETIYWSNYGRLEWLEYNIKRSLGTECSEGEIPMGISEARNSISHIIFYHKAYNDIIRNCAAIS